MNILFVLQSLDMGGVEVVTAILANKFVSENHQVYVFAFEKRSGKVLERFVKEVKVTIGGIYKDSSENVDRLRQLFIDRNIEVVINQWGLPLIPIKTVSRAKAGLTVRIISVFHNDPLQNGRIQGVESQILKTDNLIVKLLLRCKKQIYRCITGFAMRYIYQHSDVFEVLSPTFVSHFQIFTWLKKTPKLVVQTNPITINNEGFVYNPNLKKKEIIYVGRVDYTQKRVSRVIETWAQLEHLFPEWSLTIVGDGEERGNLEQIVKEQKLQHVSFEGFQQPRPYYERASILVLASEFEGFPLVLAECMSFGVIPVVYGSYSAVYDIIEDGKDGIIVSKTTKGFNAAMMAERCRGLMENEKKLKTMALAAIEKSKNYSIDKIYEQWITTINNL